MKTEVLFFIISRSVHLRMRSVSVKKSKHILCSVTFIIFSYQIFFSPTDGQVNCLKTILKFTFKLTLKQLRHVSVQSHHHQGAYYSCLLKLQLIK